MYPHRIRLRGPWSCFSDRGQPPKTVKIPCRWRDVGLEGPATFVRHFGAPPRRDDQERVWLIAGTRSSTQLNGISLEPVAAEWDITDLLRPRNELAIAAGAGDPDAEPFGDVALEIRMPAWLADVTVSLDADRRLRICGTLRGEADCPLDLYAILGRFTIAQGTVAAGTAFDLASEPLRPDQLRADEHLALELVNGPIVWYRVELSLPENTL